MGGATVVIDADVLGRRRTGDETYVMGLLRQLGGMDTCVRFLATTRHPELVPAGVEAVNLPVLHHAIRMSVTLPRALRSAKAGLAHFQYVVPPLWRGRSVITVHDLSFEHHPEFFSPGDRALLRGLVPGSARRAEKVFTVSNFTAADLIERYRLPQDKVVVTPNGLDPAFGPDGPRYCGDRPYLLFVGALQPRKDPLCAVRALARLDQGLDLLMVGPPKRAVGDVVAAIDKLKLTGRVHLVGHVDTDELARLYRGAECLVFPSRYEGFGLPALEAMASGVPVVAAASSALPETVGDAGILFPAGDDEALAAGVCAAGVDRERLVAAGLRRAARFQWSDLAARTLATYRQLL